MRLSACVIIEHFGCYLAIIHWPPWALISFGRLGVLGTTIAMAFIKGGV